MMKYLYITFLGTLILFGSCSKLDQLPLNGPSNITYLSNETELEYALNGLYSANTYTGADITLPHFLSMEAATDIAFDRTTGGGLQLLGIGNVDPGNSYATGGWKNAYTVIGACNFLLENMHRAKNNVNAKTYAEIEGQARVMRAYTYHYLIEQFGAVPLVTTMVPLEAANVARTSKEEVCDFILSELDAAAAVLPDDYTGTAKASKTTALALKARTALYNGRWEVAAKAAKDVMDLGVHVLDPDFSNLFTYAGQNSKEIIWSLQYLRAAGKTHQTYRNYASRNGKGNSVRVPSQSAVDAFQCIDGKDIDKSPLYDPKHPFKNRDPRLAYSIALPGSIYMNYQFETHKDSLLCWNYNTTPATRVNNEDATNAYASFTGYCWRKYVEISDMNNPAECDENIAIIRYAEVLLTYAEAKIEAGQLDQSVYDAINAVRQRKSVAMPKLPQHLSQAELRSAVRKERLYEFAGEGLRLFDIRRWRIAEKVMNGPFYGRIPKGLLSAAPKIDENGIADYSLVSNKDDMRIIEVRRFSNKENRDYLWPIPEREITANPSLVQNPGF